MVGDRRWISDVTEHYYQEIYCYCRRHVDTDDMAYEVTQSVFLRFCEQYRSVDRRYVRAWLYRVAYHLCADYYRAEYKRREWMAPMPPDLEDPAYLTEDRGMTETELTDAVSYLLSCLSESERVLFCERYQLHLPYEDMAQRRNTTAAAVRKRVSRMRSKLKRLAHRLFSVLLLLWK